MIQLRTRLVVRDNSGGKQGRCIQVYKNPRVPNSGDLVLVSLRKVKSKGKSKVKKGDVLKGLLLHTSRPLHRKDGTRVLFCQPNVLLLTSKMKPMGSRLKAMLPYEVRAQKWVKLGSMGRGWL